MIQQKEGRRVRKGFLFDIVRDTFWNFVICKKYIVMVTVNRDNKKIKLSTQTITNVSDQQINYFLCHIRTK
jgi:hypothetical protein